MYVGKGLYEAWPLFVTCTAVHKLIMCLVIPSTLDPGMGGHDSSADPPVMPRNDIFVN